ncbi:ABC transporter ATP-binding protein [Ethanoligenens sp.]|uniref:ABC transporter ATP-binding protein n=1 Tax=Ethanoligenens sp. TaxID=2099655 RepID=UPI0039E7FA49
MIEVSHLTKRYGEKYAVRDISFDVKDGEILGFLGPNGAGKSTTMNILTGYLSSNEGTVKIDGVDVLEQPLKAKKNIGYLPEQPPLYPDMTVDEYLTFVFGLKQCKLGREAHLAEICGLVRIQNVRGRLIRNLSKGYKQRVGIAQALIGNPDVLILDEPTVGLDPKQIIEIRTLIKHLSRKHTVILSSHILPEVQSVCERIVIINEGRIVADDTTANLSSQISTDHRLIARIAGPENEVRDALSELTGVRKCVSLGEHEADSLDWQIECDAGQDIRRALFSVLSAKEWPLLALDTGELTLEDIFLRLTTDSTVLPAKRTAADNTAEETAPEQQGEDDNA